jgi:RNA polymerase sigma factor (sigma-70 family)
MKAGAMDFLTKPVDRLTLLACVREALALSSRLQEQAYDTQSRSSWLAKLTEREREVIVLAIAGYSSKEIAQRLNLSYRTVENHRSHVMQKTGASNILELARDAIPVKRD